MSCQVSNVLLYSSSCPVVEAPNASCKNLRYDHACSGQRFLRAHARINKMCTVHPPSWVSCSLHFLHFMVCLENRPCQQFEPLKSHEIPPLPWAKVGTDLLHKNGRNYLVTIEYYSKWPELTLLNSMTSTAVITALKSQFARYGVPSVQMSDNSPCYSSEQFKQFSQDWCFDHITLSPGYPQSNGQSERSVKTLKEMLEKSDDPYKALLSFFRTEILRWMELTCRRLRCSWVDV